MAVVDAVASLATCDASTSSRAVVCPRSLQSVSDSHCERFLPWIYKERMSHRGGYLAVRRS